MLAAALTLATLPAIAAEEGKDSAHEQMAQAWRNAGAPGPEHKRLESRTGEWDTLVTYWHGVGQPPVQSRGRATARMVLDGRFLEETVVGEAQGMPFRGMGLLGYDNLKQKYTSSWVDNASTAIFTMVGDCTPDQASCRFQGRYDNPVTGKSETMRVVANATDPDRRVSEFYMPGPDGTEHKGMEIVYTRRR